MARLNSRFLNQKIIIGNKSIQEGDLTDSARDALGADSDFVKTVENLPGGNIAASSISPSSIADQDQLVSSTGALTTGGILTISRDGGNSFINFDDSSQFQAIDSSLEVLSTPTGFDFITRTPIGAAPTYQGPIPLNASSRIRIHLNTPIQNQQDLLHFFNVNAATETDEIHSVQILDSATENNHDFALKDESGVLHYLNLLDSIPFGDPRLTYVGGDNEVDIISGRRLWEGIKGAKLANSTPEFTHDATSNISTRNVASRLRFRTRKSVPSGITGGAPSTYKLDAPEGPIGEGVSNPVYSKVSERFVYKVAHVSPGQGYLNGYTAGGYYNLPAPTNLPIPAPSNTDTNPAGYKRQKFPFSGPAQYAYITGGDLSDNATGGAGHSSSIKGYSTGDGIPYQVEKFPASNFFEFAFASETSVTFHPAAANDIWGSNASAQQSDTHGYTAGGKYISPAPAYPQAPSNTLRDFPTLTTASSNDRRQKFPFYGPAQYAYITGGDLLGENATGGTGHSTFTKGYSTGNTLRPDITARFYPGYTFVEFPFASETSVTLHPRDAVDQWGAASSSQQSDTHGYTLGHLFYGPSNFAPLAPSNTSASPSDPVYADARKRQKFPFTGAAVYAYITGGDLSNDGMGGTGHSSHAKGYSTGDHAPADPRPYPAANFFEFPFASETSVTLHPATANDIWGIEASPQFQ